MSIQTMTTNEFLDYLGRIESDLRESGHNATANDYKEAAIRIRALMALTEVIT